MRSFSLCLSSVSPPQAWDSGSEGDAATQPSVRILPDTQPRAVVPAHAGVCGYLCVGSGHSQPRLSWSSDSCPSDPQGGEQLWLWTYGQWPKTSGSWPPQPHHHHCMSPQGKGQSLWDWQGLLLALCLQPWGGTQLGCGNRGWPALGGSRGGLGHEGGMVSLSPSLAASVWLSSQLSAPAFDPVVPLSRDGLTPCSRCLETGDRRLFELSSLVSSRPAQMSHFSS